MNFKIFTFILLFVFCFCGLYAQVQNNYTTQWNQVDEFVKKGLTKSALDEAIKIYEKAKKENNDPQIIKALIFRVTLNRNLEENANVKAIALVEKEMATAKEPARSILNSILAEMYWTFLQQNRYKFYNRTQTLQFVKEDILTWGLEDLHKKISQVYLSSIKEEKKLQQTKLDPLDAIIIKGNARHLRPTLYDLLAHRALDYFTNTERDITKPAYAFEIKDEKALAPAKEFISHKFISKDSNSLHHKALLIYQELLQFHLADVKADALIDADIDRLNFVKQHGVMLNKQELYLLALTEIAKYNSPASAQAMYLIAQEIYNSASQEKTSTDTTAEKYTINQAKKIADAVIKFFPQSEGGINAKNLLNQILHKELNLTSEKVNVPGEPFRTLVTYKNISSISLRLIELTPETKKLLEQDQDQQLLFNKLVSQRSIRSWKQALPLPDDYKLHSTEIKIDALPVGEFALLASAADDFNLDKNPLSAQYFYVSNISYVNNGPEYFVLDRTTGKPLPGAKVQVWNQRYDYQSRKSIFEKLELLTADKNGYLKINEGKKGTERNIRLEITYQKDKLFLSEYQYNYYYNSEDAGFENQKKYDEARSRIFLFTDRSIYRPGQLVYFKGIGVTQDYKTKKNQLLQSKDSITVLLKDANYQNVDSIKVLLNEFGSFNGNFKLPENRLNGNFIIIAGINTNNQTSFSVEEYKRPKFYAEFEKVKGTYKVNEKVKITGFAKAYAGNNVDGAKVKYRVTRIARFLYPWRFWGRGFPQTRPMEITNGEVVTASDGKFIIEFEAIPDLTIDKSTDPVFDYRVEADITDINGETRSTSTIVPIGYKALNLQVIIPNNGTINIDSLNHINVTTQNLSGEFEPSKVEVKIYKLQSPDRLIRSRYWSEPDQFVMDKAEFLRHFPYDEYKSESKKETWAKGEISFSRSDSTKPTTNFKLQTTNFSQGWYVVEATAKDKYGQEVKDVKYFEVYDMKAASLPAPSNSWNTVVKAVAEPGEKVQLISGTSANDVFLIQQKTKGDANDRSPSGNYSFYSLNNEKKIFDFPVTEDDRGGFIVSQFFVKNNRVYSNSWHMNVPWTNKQLDITFSTFRDKTLPGSEEKWKAKISGYKGQKVAAEMLAGMYDASLDQFKPHSWSALNIWPNNYTQSRWGGVQNFGTVRSFEKWWNEEYLQPKEKRYDALMSIDRGTMERLSGAVRQTSPEMMQRDASMNEVSSASVVKAPGGIIAEESQDKVYTAVEYTMPNGDLFRNGRIIKKQQPVIDQTQIQIRKNFNETAFFFPELRTDKDGNIEFSFTMPEALTQWKLMTLAHTKDLAIGYAERTIVTQKDIMVQPNAPRFVREGDKMEFTAKVVNMTDKTISGQAQLQLFNASTMAPVDQLFKNTVTNKSFTIATGQSTLVNFTIEIPSNYNNALVYRIVAKSGDVSDGEEAAIPLLTNRMLVTETMPLPVRGNTTKNFKFDKLLRSSSSPTLTHFALTAEFTTNPAWYAIQALPYLMEPKHESADQAFNRYYANSIASKIVSSSPKIKAVFDKWKITDTSALLSNLQKNEELKSVLLHETPWVLQAQNETQQKKNIALLFDMIRMNSELESSLAKLKDMQSPNGGFVWFKGGRDDRYMTQYIITGLGHLKRLGAYPKTHEKSLRTILNAAIVYLDKRLKDDYDNLIKSKAKLDQNHLSYVAVQYLYMRSFFQEYGVTKGTETAFNYYRDQSKRYWLSQSKYMQALIALSLHKTNDNTTPKAITRSLKENSINNEELGMYWKEWDNRGWFWYQAPIESQAMMIEAFSEIDKDQKVVDDLKTWLLKNKQTNNWKTTKATAEACYALLLQGTDWLSEDKNVTIKLGNTVINSNALNREPGTGYFKTKIEGDKVKSEMGNITVTVFPNVKDASKVSPKGGDLEGASSSWGGVYWQYFEDLDKITYAETPLKLNKKLFIERNSATGPVLIPLSTGGEGRGEVKVGDKIKVRIELRVDRDMEYVHMKDMRASSMEPVNVISQYKYQGGLGYYESTEDASTNFFFNYLYKGTYVFEYAMFVTHTGNFSNGITTIQSMYAPEFTSHSEGVRINVTK